MKSSGTKTMTTCVADFILQKNIAVSAIDRSLVELYIQRETMMQLLFSSEDIINSCCFWQNQLNLQ